jgi:hypothetical protein
MVHTEKTRLIAKQATYIITAHTAIYILYNYTHGKLDELFFMTEYMPIIIIFCLAPLAVVLFLSTPSARQGAVILLGILPAELIYNIYARFTALPSFSVNEPALIWKILYEGSFGVLLVLEVAAFWLTLTLLREIYKQMEAPPTNPM